MGGPGGLEEVLWEGKGPLREKATAWGREGVLGGESSPPTWEHPFPHRPSPGSVGMRASGPGSLRGCSPGWNWLGGRPPGPCG